jgi:hypothetical protein
MGKIQYSYIITNVTYIIVRNVQRLVTEICGCSSLKSGAKLYGGKICYNLIFVET